MTIEDDRERYLNAAHAMQTGVKYEMESFERSTATEPKHLRVGVNSALVETGAIVALLIEKGVITEGDWYKALADNMEREVKTYEDRANRKSGGPTLHFG